jgi:hypothetical protein
VYDELTALHEAGHAAAADALGCKVVLATVEPGEHLSGVCRYLPLRVRDDLPDTVESPLIVWPAGWQRDLGAKVVIALAGDLAEELFAPRGTASLRLAESVTAQAWERLEVLSADGPAATAAELAEAARAVSEPGRSDAKCIADIAFVAHGGDPLRAAAWLHWLSEETRALLLAHEGAVRCMAALLAEHGTLGEQAAAACLRPSGDWQ